MKRRRDDLARLEKALDLSGDLIQRLLRGSITVSRKKGGDPVTEVDLAVSEALRKELHRPGEGWLSEESKDDLSRLRCSRVWVVDPLDGTREFVEGVPEWCVSIGLVEDGVAVAGAILNPATKESYVGSKETGLRRNGRAARVRRRAALKGALVLASRTEVARGEWERFQGGPYKVQATGSVAYKLAMVAAGQADVTWTLTPKHEWDVAAGVALMAAGGGICWIPKKEPLRFNQKSSLLTGLVASSRALSAAVRREIRRATSAP